RWEVRAANRIADQSSRIVERQRRTESTECIRQHMTGKQRVVWRAQRHFGVPLAGGRVLEHHRDTRRSFAWFQATKQDMSARVVDSGRAPANGRHPLVAVASSKRIGSSRAEQREG